MEAPVANSRPARGVLYVHSSPRALCPHVEWAAGRAIGRAVNFTWDDQPVLRGEAELALRGESNPLRQATALQAVLRQTTHMERQNVLSREIDRHRRHARG